MFNLKNIIYFCSFNLYMELLDDSLREFLSKNEEINKMVDLEKLYK